jgi:hypothetical protein
MLQVAITLQRIPQPRLGVAMRRLDLSHISSWRSDELRRELIESILLGLCAMHNVTLCEAWLLLS